METIYASFVQAKNGSPVPLYKNGHAAHSRYNPEREAQATVESFPESCSFFVLIGFGSGYTARALLERRGDIKIIAIENSEQDIAFLKSEPCVAIVANDARVTLVSIDNAVSAITEQYLPAIFGDMHVAYLRSWIQENKERAEIAKNTVESAVKLVSADYSVQAHFGAIWQRNFLCNLREMSDKRNSMSAGYDYNFPIEKTAFIVAAGPSLDNTISILENGRDKYFVIATDTAYGVLRRKGISIDAAVSIDAQNVSRMHFLVDNDDTTNTLFVFDATGTTCAVRNCIKKGDVSFVTTGHPFVSYAEMILPTFSLKKISSGAGTVTIAAADFANSAGFSSIVVAGADFAYLCGKSYARGTYLDSLYYSTANRLYTAETQYDALLFRTPLNYCEGKMTTDVLDSYRKTFISWAKENMFEVSEKDGIWKLSRKKNTNFNKKKTEYADVLPDFGKFIKKIAEDINKDVYCQNGSLTPLQYAVLPYVAWLRAHGKPNDDFASLLYFAYKLLLIYDFRGEKL